jgi:hypothetical protein
MAAGMSVTELAVVPFSFPTYANALGRAAVRAAEQLRTRGAPGPSAEPAGGGLHSLIG